MTRPVLLAGLLGGVLGAVSSFALSRALPPAAKSPAPPQQAPPEARQFADTVVAKLRSGKDDEVVGLMRLAFLELPDEEFAEKVRAPFLEVRERKPYGPTLGFDLVRENVVAADLVRFVYLERFASGCVVWGLTCYNSPAGWQLIGLRHLKLEAAFEMLK